MAHRHAGLHGVTEVTAQEVQQAVAVLLPDRRVGAIGQPDFSQLLGAQPQLGVEELDQHRIAGQELQQHE
ncbi:hypothetical protein D3C71_1917520 [compost metagenome]